MTQALHIFRKDLRHQWIDLSLYLALLVITGFLIPTQWPGHWTSNAMLPWFSSLIQIVVPIMWLVMIARLVHEESLVGNRQFWTTRPYSWASLLSAKLLFLLLCIGLPYLVMECCMALYGGVSPFNAGFLVSSIKDLLIVWTPLLLVACITSTFVSTFFTVLVGMVAWTGVLAYLLGSNGPSATAPFAHVCLGVTFACIFAGLLVVLYRKRNVQLGRILVGWSALLFLLLIYSVSDMSASSIGTLLLKARYHEGAAPQLRLHYVASIKSPTKLTQEGSGRTVLTLPIELLGFPLPVATSGMPSGHRLHNASVQYTFKAGDYSYTSQWAPTTLTERGMLLHLPLSLLKRAGNADAHLTLAFAAEEIAPGTSQTTAIRDRFTIPGNGSCDAIRMPFETRPEATNIVCRFAYAVPNPIEIDANMAPSCPTPMVPIQVATREGGTGFDPLIHQPINFGSHMLTGAAKGCQVTSLTTTVYHPIAYFRTSLDIPAIRLSDYVEY